jgi:hypothetical protein
MSGNFGTRAVASSGCRSYVPLTDFLEKIPSPAQFQQNAKQVCVPRIAPKQ